MELTRDLSCFRGLNWRSDLPAGSDCDELAAALSGRGFVAVAGPSALRLLRSREGHELLLVPRTGRVQIRVHYLTPQEERRWAAERVFASLVRTILALGSFHAPGGP